MDPSVAPFKEKLERSLCSANPIAKGSIFKESNLTMLSPGGGLKWSDKDSIIGKKAKINIDKQTLLKREMFE